MIKRLGMLGSSAIAAAMMLVGAAQAGAPPAAGATDGLCTVTVNLPPPPPGAPPPDFAAIFGRPDPQAQKPQLTKVKDDFYVIQNTKNELSEILQFGGNMGVYVTNDGVILFDSKTDQLHDDIVAKIKTITDKPIKYVVVTHHHPDHSGGVAKFLQGGATIVMSRDDGRALAAGGPGAATPQEMYARSHNITLGGKQVRLTEHCGHTRGDTVAYLPAARVVIAGDLVTTPESIPTIVDYQSGGNWTDLRKSLDAIAALDFDVLVAGHGPVLTKAEFLRYRDRVARIGDRARALVKEGKSQAELTQTLTRELNYGTGPAMMTIPGFMVEFR